ncbi:UNVERIFIED_CONTAM: hypothetical protein HDU68_012222 [Siphonaria sp. JEL0065]|nr:hypothetical protein HDU68_012222 [Siphonaria sp. JEL0065]
MPTLETLQSTALRIPQTQQAQHKTENIKRQRRASWAHPVTFQAVLTHIPTPFSFEGPDLKLKTITTATTSATTTPTSPPSSAPIQSPLAPSQGPQALQQMLVSLMSHHINQLQQHQQQQQPMSPTHPDQSAIQAKTQADSALQLAPFPVYLWPLVILFRGALHLISLCSLDFEFKFIQITSHSFNLSASQQKEDPTKQQQPPQNDSNSSSDSQSTSATSSATPVHTQELFLYHHHHLNSIQKCANLVKLESLSLHIRHLRMILDAERSARTEISRVHAKTKLIVEEQKAIIDDSYATIDNQKNEIESLKDEIDSLTSRLVAALHNKNTVAAEQIKSRRIDSACYTKDQIPSLNGDDDTKSDTSSNNSNIRLRASSPCTDFQLRLPDDLLDNISEHEFDGSRGDDDDDEDATSDCGCNDDQQDDYYDKDDTEEDEEPISDIFASRPKKHDPSSDTESMHATPTQLLALSTQNLVQSLLSHTSPNSIPTLLDTLASTLPLSITLCAKTALQTLLTYMDTTMQHQESLEISPQDVATTARSLFRKHMALLSIHCSSTPTTRISTLEQLASFTHDGTVKTTTRVPWKKAFGMLVYVLVDLEVVKAEDVCMWWRREKEGKGWVFGECCGFMDRLCCTLEECCESDEDEEDEDDDDSDEEEEEEQWDDDEDLLGDVVVKRVGSDVSLKEEEVVEQVLQEIDGRRTMEDAGYYLLEGSSVADGVAERRVSFNV